LDPAVVAHRVMGAWEPTAETFARFISPETGDADASRPYPFFLAYALEEEPEELGEAARWRAEWKWDGIRAQLIRRAGRFTSGREGRSCSPSAFPELEVAASTLPDGVVLDGEILPWKNGAPLPFAQLQRRIGRKKLGPKILAEVPVALIAYDLLEVEGEDVRERPLRWRRERLEALLAGGGAHPRLSWPTSSQAGSWEAARAIRERLPRGRRGRADVEASWMRPTASGGARAGGGSGRSSRTPRTR
jgi:DNA ligase 1